MNATATLVSVLPRHAVAAMLRRLPAAAPTSGVPGAMLAARLARRFALDLAGLLNLARRGELEAMARGVEVAADGAVGELRARLWRWGALAEAGGEAALGSPVQPVPALLRGKLVHLACARGLAPPAAVLPRPLPPPVAAPAAPCEPESIDELLDNADRLVGVRLGARGRDKGWFGSAVAGLLGVVERGWSEPDWRGEVEIKTVPIVRDASGLWRVKEDPAVSMEGAAPLAKLERVLWIARVSAPASPILSWFYQEADAHVRRAAGAALHTRPKGGAGATTRGWYLHKGFFAASGFLRSLNG